MACPKKLVLRILIAMFALLAVVSGCLVCCWWEAGQRLERVEREIAEGNLSSRSLLVSRSSHFGELIDGNAVEAYKKANAALSKVLTDSSAIEGLGWSPPPFQFPPRIELERLCREAAEPFDLLSIALRCRHFLVSGRYEVSGLNPQLLQLLLARAEAARLAGQDAEALRTLAMLLGTIRDWERDEWMWYFPPLEIWTAIQWRSVLRGHALSAPELKVFCWLLDDLESDRFTLNNHVESEYKNRRRDVLYFYGTEARYFDKNKAGPAWRHLGSLRLKACDLLNDIDSDYRAVLEIEKLPSHEQMSALKRLESSLSQDRPRAESQFSSRAELFRMASDWEADAYVRLGRRMMRTATAIAWYEEEKGRPPESLAELVPRYILEVPVCPITGNPILYRGGELLATGWGWHSETEPVVWSIQRR